MIKSFNGNSKEEATSCLLGLGYFYPIVRVVKATSPILEKRPGTLYKAVNGTVI